MFEFLIQHSSSALLVAVLVLAAAACATHYKPHPGAINIADSASYDTLLVAEAAIDAARTRNQTHPLPAEAKDVLNRVIQYYNVARDAWLTYRGAIASNVPTQMYFDQLTKNLSDLTEAIRLVHERLRMQAR